jgi:hypothetical protein
VNGKYKERKNVTAQTAECSVEKSLNIIKREMVLFGDTGIIS